MAEGLNRVTLFGNLGADPELRMTTGGTATLTLRLATTESYLDRDKKRQTRTEWHRIKLFGKRAEGLGKVLSKGDAILIEGSLRTSSYEDKDGTKRYTTEVFASNVVLAGGGKGVGKQNDGYAPRGGSSSGRHDADDAAPDDDIPF